MSSAALFGRYIEGQSCVHTLDPRTKLVFALLFVVAVFCAQSAISLGVCVLFTVFFFALARIGVKQACTAVAPLLFIVVLTALLNIFFIKDGTVLVSWGVLVITDAGITSAMFVAVRLVLLLLGACLLTLTTTTLEISDGLEYLLTPFARLKFPAHDFSMIISIALRFIPQLFDEFNSIKNAQRSRGANLATSPVRKTIPFLTSVTVPLFAGIFRHAETLSYAMDARCYYGGNARTSLRPLCFGKKDAYACFVLALMFACVIGIQFLL